MLVLKVFVLETIFQTRKGHKLQSDRNKQVLN